MRKGQLKTSQVNYFLTLRALSCCGPTYLLCGVFIVVIQVLLLLALLLFQSFTDETSHLTLHPRLLSSNQEPIIS